MRGPHAAPTPDEDTMTLTAPATDLTVSTDRFDSLDPATGEVVASYPMMGAAEVAAAVERARVAAAWWSELGFAERGRRLKALRGLIAKRQDELLALMSRENGKPTADALIEVVLVMDHLGWLADRTEKALGPRKVRSTLMLANHEAVLEYKPLGVIGVIGPWNYPLFTPAGSILYALSAGNAVVFKPSEFTPGVGVWLADAVAEVVPEHPVLQVVTGKGETGRALCLAGVDKIAFTGSAATGKKIMATCAETLTPVLLELGGKDAMIVTEDADVPAAARAAVWGALSNAGQTCIGIERAYVADPVYDRFVEEVRSRAVGLVAGTGDKADYGPITMPAQIDVIRRHLDDAFARGARAVVGGPESIRPPYVDPVVLVDVPDDALVMREETFGPVLPITRVADADEAVRKANDTAFGLGGAVYGGAAAKEIAGRLRSGMTSVNSVLAFAGIPELPFGGVGESGFGRIHGEDGLKEFTRAKAITHKRYGIPFEMMVFDRPSYLPGLLRRVLKLRYGR